MIRGVIHGQDNMEIGVDDDDHFVRLIQQEYRKNSLLLGEVSDDEPELLGGKDSFFGPPIDQGSRRGSLRGSIKSVQSNTRS